MNPEILESYRLLEIDPGASGDVVRTAYLELVQVWHPGRFQHDPALKRKATERLNAINAAYERLCRFYQNRPTSGLAAAQDFQNDVISATLVRGEQFYDLGELNAALAEYDKVLLLDRDHQPGLLGRSLCYIRFGKYREASVDANRAWDLDPSNQIAIDFASYCEIILTLEGGGELPPGIHLRPFQDGEKRQVNQAVTSYIQPHKQVPEPRVLLLFDTTFWGGAGHGLCLCEEAVYWKSWPGEICHFKKYSAIQSVKARVPNLEIDGEAIIGSAFISEASLVVVEKVLLRLVELHRGHAAAGMQVTGFEANATEPAKVESTILTNDTFSGWFVGTCKNTTVGVSANLLLFIHAMTENTVHGELGLSGELDGGGPFHGTINNQTMAFKTCSPEVQAVIEWRAQMSLNKLSGEYTVICEHPQAVVEGLARSEGNWSCNFVRSPGAVDPDRYNHAWVFDAGLSEGPFAMEEFAQQAASGRWPDKAIVALEDCTAWTTVGEFLAAKAANEN